jgi:hypothetical protein
MYTTIQEWSNFQMPRYKITVEYNRSDTTSKENLRVEPLCIEAESLAEAMTSQQVAEAINRLDKKMVDKQVDSWPAEVAAEAVASLASLYNVQVCGEIDES